MLRKWFSRQKAPEAGSAKAAANGWSDLIQRLRGLGMWDDADPAELESEFDSMITRQNFWLVDSPRFIMADSEEFAEGGIGEWLDEFRDELARYGFTFQSHEDHCDEQGYDFVLDGTRHTVYTEQQLQQHGNATNIWEIATRFVQQMINTQFRSKGIETRAYLFYGGNDGQLAMLTPQMANAMIDSGLIEKKEQPFRLDSES